MRHFRLSLLELLIGTALAGISCAALVKASSATVSVSFFVLLTTWLISTAIVASPLTKSRPFWFAFLISSLVTYYHGYATPIDRVFESAWDLMYGPEPTPPDPFEDPFASISPALNPYDVVTLIEIQPAGAVTPPRVMFVATARSVFSLWVGLLTGLLARAIHRWKQTTTSDAQHT